MKNSVLVILLLVLATATQAQNFSKTDVITVKRRNMGTIMQEGQVKGYYYFYNVEKKDRKNNNYLLSILDENLHEIKSVPIVRPNTYYLIDAAFNGAAFAFLFYDANEKRLELIGYDKTLKQMGKVLKEVSGKMTQAGYNFVAQGNEPMQAYLIAVPDQGFIHYGMKAGARGDYEIEFYDNAIKKKWSTPAPDDEYDFENAGEAFVDGDYVGSLIARRKGLMSTDIDFAFIVQSAADGKKLFNIPLETSTSGFAFSQAFFDKDKQQFIVFGEYYKKGENTMKGRSLGFITVTLDMTGKVVAEKTNPWKAIEGKVAAKDKERFQSSSILFHDFIRTSDGHLFAIGEQYEKGGLPMAVKLNVYNMIILEFDQNFDIAKAEVFEKDKNGVDMPRGFILTTTKILSYYAKSIGGFDYVFSNLSKDKSTFLISYVNYDREKGQKAKNVLSTIVYTPEKTFTVDKMDLNRKSSAYFVMPAKEGYVMVSEYFEKDKRMDNRLEKVNF
jgi:hypothetical protein